MPIDFPPTEVPVGWYTILDALRKHDVQYVIAGSTADAIVESDPASAAGLVVAPAPYRRNLERLTTALGTLAPRLRGSSAPFTVSQIADRPAVRWHLHAAGVDLDIVGSAVGDGEFSIRLWRTRPIELTCADGSVVAEVELSDQAARLTHTR
jgi:hypothetical protein